VPCLQAFVCKCCKGRSGLLLAMDPRVNPQHYMYLTVQGRRAFGGGMGAAARGAEGGGRDMLIAGMELAKLALGFYGAAQFLGMLLRASRGSR
jgi:hypothetical protein